MTHQDSAAPPAVRPERARTAAELAAVLDASEDDLEKGCDAEAALAVAGDVEAAAEALGEIELEFRARLLRADMSERTSRPTAVGLLWQVNRWASEHGCRPLLARSHLLPSRAYNNLIAHAAARGVPLTAAMVDIDHGVTTTVPGAPAVPTQSTLLAAADKNLYAAKHGGRDRVVSGHHPETHRRRYRDAATGAG